MEYLRRYWSLFFLFGATGIALLGSILEEAFIPRLSQQTAASLQEFLPIDSTDINTVERLTIDRNGNPFSAIQLNGVDNFFLMSNPAIGSIPDDFSFCFWVKPAHFGKTQTLFQKGESCPDENQVFNGQSYEILIDQKGSVVMILVGPPGNGTGKSIQFTSEKKLEPDKWTFVVISFIKSDKEFNCFINAQPSKGKLSGSTSAPFEKIYQTHSVLKIGGNENYCGHLHYFTNILTGCIDEVYIFKRPLDPSEIKDLYEPESKRETKYKIALAVIFMAFLAAVLMKRFY